MSPLPGGWQVTLCDPIWHVSFRSGDGRPACKLLYRLVTTLSGVSYASVYEQTHSRQPIYFMTANAAGDCSSVARACDDQSTVHLD